MNIDVDRLVRLAAGAGDALRARADELACLRADLAALDGQTCTGVEYVRREAGKPDRLYMNHGTDQACPLHGKPEPGGRLRSYVGSDPDRIAEARAAMALEKRRADLEREVGTAERGLAACGNALRHFYGLLGYNDVAMGEW